MRDKVLVRAVSIEEARIRGAKLLGAAVGDIECTIVETRSDGGVSVMVRPKKYDASVDPGRLLDRLESELATIETGEILGGFSTEELEDKGILNEQAGIEVDRSPFSSARKEGEFRFCENVEYYVAKKHRSVTDIPYKEIEHLKDAQAGEQIGWRELPISQVNKQGANPSSYYTAEYLDNSNVRLAFLDNKFSVFAKVRGKVVLLVSGIYLIPSDRDGEFDLRIENNGMTAYIDLVAPKGKGNPISVENILKALKEKKVVYGVERLKIHEAVLAAIATGQDQLAVCIAHGLEPVQGRDAGVTLHFDTEANVQDFRILPDGRVDYKKDVVVTSVKKGDLLATVQPAKKGIEGKDILGRIRKARDGNPQVLFCGDNVTQNREKTSFFAECEGQPILNKNLISVYRHYFVSGDVDHSTGNISFNGNVTVKGTIRPDFEVRASGDVTVGGSVDSGRIDAGRNIKVFGGIVGNDQTVIKCGKDLFAGYLQNAIIEAQGDVLVLKSIIQSTVYCTGDVLCNEQKGTVVGGCVYALKSIDIKVAGSSTGTRTELVAGHDFLVRKIRDEFMTAFQFYTKNLEKLNLFLKPILAMVQRGETLEPQIKQRMGAVMKKYAELEKSRAIIEAKLNHIEQIDNPNYSATISIRQKCYADVKVMIGTAMRMINQDQSGALFGFDPQTRQIETRAGKIAV
jgi:uncharacterized protein (DUF342 family)